MEPQLKLLFKKTGITMVGSSSDEVSSHSPKSKKMMEQMPDLKNILRVQRARPNAPTGHTTVREVKDQDEKEGWRKYLIGRGENGGT
ncbi:hypothetical protein CR513_12982, partial [Mucuna pruriens]